VITINGPRSLYCTKPPELASFSHDIEAAAARGGCMPAFAGHRTGLLSTAGPRAGQAMDAGGVGDEYRISRSMKRPRSTTRTTHTCAPPVAPPMQTGPLQTKISTRPVACRFATGPTRRADQRWLQEWRMLREGTGPPGLGPRGEELAPTVRADVALDEFATRGIASFRPG